MPTILPHPLPIALPWSCPRSASPTRSRTRSPPVVPGSPAASAGIEAGDTITAAKFVLPKDVADIAGNEAVKLSDRIPIGRC